MPLSSPPIKFSLERFLIHRGTHRAAIAACCMRLPRFLPATSCRARLIHRVATPPDSAETTTATGTSPQHSKRPKKQSYQNCSISPPWLAHYMHHSIQRNKETDQLMYTVHLLLHIASRRSMMTQMLEQYNLDLANHRLPLIQNHISPCGGLLRRCFLTHALTVFRIFSNGTW